MNRALFLVVVALGGIIGCGSRHPGSAGANPGSSGAGRFITEPGEYQLGELWLKLEKSGDTGMGYGFRWRQGKILADAATRDTKSEWFLYWLPPNELWRYDGDKQLTVHSGKTGTMMATAGGMLPFAWSVPALANAPKEVMERIPAELRPKPGKP